MTGASFATELNDSGQVSAQFMLGPDYTEMFGILLRYIAKEKPGAKVAFVYSDTEFGRDPIASSRAGRELGLKVVTEIMTPPGSVDVSTGVIKLRRADPDYTIFHGYVLAPIPEFVGQGKRMGLKTRYMGTFWTMDNSTVMQMGEDAEGFMGVMPYRYYYDQAADAPMLKIREMRPQYQSTGYMQGFLAAMLFTEAAKRTLDAGKDLSAANMKAALDGIKDFDTGGLIGVPISMKGNSIPVGRIYRADVKQKQMVPASDWIVLKCKADAAMTEGQEAAALLDINNIEVVYNKAVQVLRGLSCPVPAGGIVALLGSNGGQVHHARPCQGCWTWRMARAGGRAHRFRWRRHRRRAAAEPGARRAGARDGRAARVRGPERRGKLVAATYALTGRRDAADFDLVYGYPRLHERRKGLAGYLSGGEQQMLAIGRALIAQPKLMLLDEPSLGLSPMLVENIFSIIARINREQGVAMLLVEQNAPWRWRWRTTATSWRPAGGDRRQRRQAGGGPGRARVLPGRGRRRRDARLPRHQALQAPQAVAVMSGARDRMSVVGEARPAWPELTLPQMLREQARRQPDGLALRQKDFGIWKPSSWAEYWRRACRVGLGLRALGLAPGGAWPSSPRTASSGC